MKLEINLQPKQDDALTDSYHQPVTFFGGSKGGGKSYLVRAREVIRRLEYPNTTGSIIRKTFPELRANHILPMWLEYPELKQYYNKQDKTIYYPNGSTTTFNHLQYTDDVYNYQGIALDDISIDEVTQHEEDVFKILRSSNRRSNTDKTCKITPTMFLTGNPGGIGHQFIKRLFVDKEYKIGEKPEDFLFIKARLQDNPALLRVDPEYVDRLKALPEQQRRAYLDGDWNIFSGLAFSELSERVHLIEPFQLDPSVKYFGGYDYGFVHPFAFVLFAITKENEIYVVDYIKKDKKRPDEQGRMILDKIKNYHHIYIHAGTDIWANKTGRGTIQQELSEILRGKATLVKGYTDRIDGVNQIRKKIAFIGTKTAKPQLYFFRNCIEVYNNIKSMQFDMKRPEDVIKVDADENGEGGDDLYDGFRMGVMGIVYPPKEQDKEPSYKSGQYLLDLIEQDQQYKERTQLWR